MRDFFYLHLDITFLNYGSFGATPKPIMQAYHELQIKTEVEPVQEIAIRSGAALKQARQALAQYLNCDASHLVYVLNPSYAVNIVAKNFPLQAGDEVLATNIEYGACDTTWQYYCEKASAKYIRANISLPLISEEQFAQEMIAAMTSKTKLLFISHITSATGIRLPIEPVIAAAKERGIPVFVDGAHAPGHIELDLATLGVDFYTGACHKWMMAPKGCSFLYAKPYWHKQLDPLLISWGYCTPMPMESVLIDNHQLQGTRDWCAFLTLPYCIEFMNAYNWQKVSEQCKLLVRQNTPRFEELLQCKAPGLYANNYYDIQMLSLPIRTSNAAALQALLYNDYKIEIPVFSINGDTYLRFSIQVFNTQQDLDVLYKALTDLIAKGVVTV